MCDQLVFIGEPSKVEADHLVRAERRLFAGPQRDQHAGDNRTISLDLDAVLITAQQMPTAEHVLEEAEEYFDRPTL